MNILINLEVENKFEKLIYLECFLAICFFVAFNIYFIPSLESNIRIHDTFDGLFTSRHVLVNSGYFFDLNPETVVPGIMNGLPRGVMFRFTDITALLMLIFGSLPGFSLTFLIVRIVAFLGMYLFGRDYLKIKSEQKGILTLASVAFSCLPFFVIHGLTVSGIPFLIWSFFNLLLRKRVKVSFLVIVLFGLWSQMVLVGFHIILILSFIFLYWSFKEKKIHWLSFISILTLVFVYIVSEYMLFYMHIFSKDYESSRAAFEKILGLNYKGVVGGTFMSFFTGDYSTSNYFGYLFIPLILVYAFLTIRKREFYGDEIGLMFFVVLLVSAFCINLLDWKGVAFFYERFPVARIFNFKRFTSILPGFFFLFILAVSIKINSRRNKLSHILTMLTLIILNIFIWRGNISYNNSGFKNTGIKIEKEEVVTFNQFFDPSLYHEIKMEMGKDSITNLIHFGLSPSPSKYAGIPVLDDYQGDYPKAYKIEFRKIIEKELNKSKKLEKYFDEWGSRCYLYSANQIEHKLTTRENMPFEPRLEIDLLQLKNMKCHYLLSKILIGNAKSLGLSIQKVLVGRETKQIHILYKII